MTDAAAGPTQMQIYKVALASIVGSVIEQFDFLVTGVIAATVWGGVFFKLPGIAAVAAAIGVYGIGIIIRPIGAYIFGNIADRRGRKEALVYALVLMGVSTLLIGLTPSYDSIGIAAPVLLIIFRLLQGISFGAEFGTASTWVVEQAARSKYRAFWGAWVGFAIPIGLLLGFGSVIFTKSLMTRGAIHRLGLAHSVRHRLPGGDRRPHHPHAHAGQLCVRAAQVAKQGSRLSRAPGLARHAGHDPAHLAGECDVRRGVLPLLRVRHQLHEGGRLCRLDAGADRADRRGVHAGVHDHRLAARRHHQPADHSVDCRRSSSWSLPSRIFT